MTTATPTILEMEEEAVRQIEQSLQIASRKQQQKVRLLTQLIDVIFAFCTAFSGVTLHEYQIPFARRLIESILINDGAKITALYARQSGKTETIGFVVSGLAVLLPRLAQIELLTSVFPKLKYFEKGIWIGIFAPVLDQSSTLFRRIREKFNSRTALQMLEDPDIQEEVEASNGAILSLLSGSKVECRSAAPTSNIESKTYHLLIIDESQDVDSNKIRKSISPMGAYTRATMVMAGTPNTIKSAFYDQISKNKQDLINNPNGPQNHFEYDYTTVEKYNPRYKDYINDEKAAYGEDSDEFRMSYRLQWIFERGMFISEDVLIRKVYNRMFERGEFVKFRGWSVIAGLDFGKSQDSTIATIGVADWRQPITDSTGLNYHYRCVVLDWLELYGDDWNTQYHQLIEFFNRYPTLTKMVADSTGVGAGLVDRFMNDMPQVEIEEFAFSLQSKSDGYKNLNMTISKDCLWMPYGEETKKTREFKTCVHQLTELTKVYKGQNMVCEAPDNVRGAHDDYPDSLMMFAWAAKEPAVNSFEQSDFSPYSSGAGNWFLKG
jgi:hypothetical protein